MNIAILGFGVVGSGTAEVLTENQKLIAERETLAEAIHAQCGPTTARDNKNPASWDWIKGPWPWEPNAN